MTVWIPTTCHALFEWGGRTLRLDVEPSDIKGSDAWYWKITDEEGKVVRSGCSKKYGAAKAVCTRAAKSYLRNPHNKKKS